ncbi:unnamed protein product [Rhizophagus irregularis]|nr:unnamed protein product [Rhizophagus irregularis]
MTRPRKPTATKGSRGSSLKTNSKVREVREKSIIDSPHDNEHESSNEREVRAQHDEADYLESMLYKFYFSFIPCNDLNKIILI